MCPYTNLTRTKVGQLAAEVRVILKSTNTWAAAYFVQVVKEKIIMFRDVNVPALWFVKKIVD
jgi:hypothetical protein